MDGISFFFLGRTIFPWGCDRMPWASFRNTTSLMLRQSRLPSRPDDGPLFLQSVSVSVFSIASSALRNHQVRYDLLCIVSSGSGYVFLSFDDYLTIYYVGFWPSPFSDTLSSSFVSHICLLLISFCFLVSVRNGTFVARECVHVHVL